MTGRKRARELGIKIGTMEPGANNAITDVPGVLVGHSTLYEPERGIATGVTAVLPHTENIYRRKVRAACHVINGRGKAVGLPEIREFGTLETPIILTSTLQVGMTTDTLVRYMLEHNPEICDTAGSVNPVVLECCDMYLNDARSLPLAPEHVLEAIETASGGPVKQGCVGAGTGMRCMGFKSGIGTASRVIAGKSDRYILGKLVMSNYGHTRHDILHVKGMEIPSPDRDDLPSKEGSIVVVLATDAPLDARQLGRIARRVQSGIARSGSLFSSGSGDFVLAFATSDKSSLPEKRLNAFFAACIEVTEESILDSILCAKTTRGRDGRVSHAIDPQHLLNVLEGRSASG